METPFLLEICMLSGFLVFGLPANLYSMFRQIRFLVQNSRAKHPDGHRCHTLSPQWVTGTQTILLGLNLAVANLIILLSCGGSLAWFVTYVWHGGESLCKFHAFCRAFGYHLYSNTVTAIALDMCMRIKSPLNCWARGAGRVKSWVVICWGGAVLCSAPHAYVWGLGRIPNTQDYQCLIYNLESAKAVVVYQLFHTILVFFVPLMVIISAYIATGICLFRQMNIRDRLEENPQCRDRTPSMASAFRFGEHSASRTTKIKCRFLKSTVAIVACYIILWLPNNVLALWSTLCLMDMSVFSCDPIAPAVFEFLADIVILNSCLSPFLYKFRLDGYKNSSSTENARHCWNDREVLVAVNNLSLHYTRYHQPNSPRRYALTPCYSRNIQVDLLTRAFTPEVIRNPMADLL